MTTADTTLAPRDSAALSGALGAFGRVVLGAGATLMGGLSLVHDDFAKTWQPVPAWAPIQPLLAYASGALLAACGLALLLDRFTRMAAGALAGFLFSWVVLLHVPRLLAGVSGAWVAPAECLAVAAGALTLVGLRAPASATLLGPMAVRAGGVFFGLTLPLFGIAHFIYIDITASMVPAWIPARVFWAYFTGAGHVAAGLSIVSGVLTRFGASLLALMFSGFVMLVHIPRVLADAGARFEWHMLASATLLSGAAWIVAAAAQRRGNIAQD